MTHMAWLKVMLHDTICNDDFNATQRCNIVSNGYNIVPTLQHCVALKLLLRIIPCNITLMAKIFVGNFNNYPYIIRCKHCKFPEETVY